jgi:hypothetical protein
MPLMTRALPCAVPLPEGLPTSCRIERLMPRPLVSAPSGAGQTACLRALAARG